MVGEQQTAAVKIETATFWCEGDVAMPAPGGYKGRVLDVFNGASDFVALTDVLLHRRAEADAEPVEYDVLLIRKAEIEYIVPLD